MSYAITRKTRDRHAGRRQSKLSAVAGEVRAALKRVFEAV
jgi:hypothetical protein